MGGGEGGGTVFFFAAGVLAIRGEDSARLGSGAAAAPFLGERVWQMGRWIVLPLLGGMGGFGALSAARRLVGGHWGRLPVGVRQRVWAAWVGGRMGDQRLWRGARPRAREQRKRRRRKCAQQGLSVRGWGAPAASPLAVEVMAADFHVRPPSGRGERGVDFAPASVTCLGGPARLSARGGR